MKNLVLFLLAIFLVTGCGSSGTTSRPSVAYAIVLDYSESTKPVRKAEIGLLLAELEEAPVGSAITVFRMGRNTDEVYDGILDESTVDTVIPATFRDMGESDPERGTDFAAMTTALNSWAARTSCSDLRIRVISDGGNDYAKDSMNAKSYLCEARKLASNSKVSTIAFLGVATGWRELIRVNFADARSLQVKGLGETTDSN